MASKIFNFIASSSERSRKIIAGIAVGIAGIMLFFAWTAGVSARLPLLGSEFQLQPGTDADSRLSRESAGNQPTPSIPTSQGLRQASVSPMRGLMDSFQDLVRLFRGEYPVIPDSSSAAPSTPARPIDDLFDTIADEKTPASPELQRGESATTTPPENLPPIEDLPGL